MAKRVKIGDVLQILTSEGVAYAQYTHKSERYGYLLAVFASFFPDTPKDFESIVEVEPHFFAFFPLQTAVNQGLLTVVGNVPVAPRNQEFPIFRSRAGGKGGACWLWNGIESWRLESEFTEEELKYSRGGIISAPLLIERIQEGYRPETHER